MAEKKKTAKKILNFFKDSEMRGVEQWNTKLSYRYNKNTGSDQSLNQPHICNQFQP